MFPVFSECVASGGHAKSMRLVAEKRCDVCCLDSVVVDRMRSDNILCSLLDNLRPLKLPSFPLPVTESLSRDNFNSIQTKKNCSDEYLGPNPAQPVVASNRLPRELIDRIRQAFESIKERPDMADKLNNMKATGYIGVKSDLYAPTEHYMHHCHNLELLGDDGDDNFKCHA